MKKTLTKVLAIVLALVMLATVLPMALATEDIASGTAGEGVSWVLDSDGTLTISGNGPIVVGWYEPPWEAYNDSILNIVVEEGITLIPNTAFCYAKKCVSISIPASVETIETDTTPFWSNNSLEKLIVDENNVNYKSVDGILFSEDGKTLVFFPASQGETEYTIPADVNSIAEDAFLYSKTVKKVTIPDTVTSIGEDAFGCSEIKEISLGNGVTVIPSGCFSYSSIKSIVIPDNVKCIDISPFWSCIFLETFVIGSGVETIDQYSVGYTNSLATIHYNGTQEDWEKIVICDNNEDLLSKGLHFVAQKEGTAPTCIEGNTAGLYCEICDKYFTGDVIPAVSEHNFNSEGFCGVCGEECDHSSGEYIQKETGHQFKCEICGLLSETESHDIEHYKDMENGKCVPYCYDCGYLEALAKPHSMTAYISYDEKNCVLCCYNCGYSDESTGLVPHSMTAYDYYDEDYCIKYCDNCGYGDPETGLVKHSFDDGTVVPATEKETEYTKYVCVNCKHFYTEHNADNAIMFDLYSKNKEQWENSAILVYVNGEPTNLIRNMSGNECETFAMPYDKNSSYVFKWINGGYGEEDYVHHGIYTYTDEAEFDIVNTYITGYYGNFGIYDGADVTINLYGANALAAYETYDRYAGIDMEEVTKLHIKDSNGSLVVIGEDDCAGIGSENGKDNGEIIIDGSTIFALSVGDGAGIGGGYEGGAGKITINGGKIWAECMSDDGSGIGVGDDGNGGEIIINGGDIIALSLDDDGAGIGGADSGHIDSVTINGGNIVAGSEDGAAIGGGQNSDSFGGKITINGGNISASEWHDFYENLIGNGNSDSKGEDKDNFVQLNGGNIDVSNSNGIFPEPKDKNGNAIEKKQITVHESLIGQEITIELSDGSKITVIAESNEISVYAPKNATVENATDLATGYCDHMCHQGGFMGFFWKIFNFFSKLFGSNPVCKCGEVHY